MSKKATIFISYAREDYKFALMLYNDLKKAGFSPWLDKKKLIAGQDWLRCINKSIKNSNFFIALMSSNSVSKRGIVQKELKIAIDVLNEFPPEDIFIIPVRIDDCKPLHEKIESLHWADLFPSYKDGLNQILKVLLLSDKKIIPNKKQLQKDKIISKNLMNEVDKDKYYKQHVETEIVTIKSIDEGLKKNYSLQKQNIDIEILQSKRFKTFDGNNIFYINVHKNEYELIETFQIRNISGDEVRFKEIIACYYQNKKKHIAKALFSFEPPENYDLQPYRFEHISYKLFANNMILQNVTELELIFEYLIPDNGQWKKKQLTRYLKLIISDAKKGYLLAINLGTTKTLCAAITKHELLDQIDWKKTQDLYNKTILTIKPIAEKDKIIPTTIEYLKDDNTNPGYTIGSDALISYIEGKNNSYRGFIRYLGSKSIKFNIFKGNEVLEYSADKLTLDYLTLLKKKIEEMSGVNFAHIIFTIPNTFSFQKIKIFEKIIQQTISQESAYELIDEATARAIFYINQIKGKYHLVLYHFGSRAIEISYFLVNNTSELVIDHIGNEGLSNFGGDNISESIAKIVVKKLKSNNNNSIHFINRDNHWGKVYLKEGTSNHQKLWNFCENIKPILFQNKQIKQVLPPLFFYNELRREVQINNTSVLIHRNEVYQEIFSKIDESIKIVFDLLKCTDKDDNNKLPCHLYLSGLSSRIPLVKEIFNAYSTGKLPVFCDTEIKYTPSDEPKPVQFTKNNFDDIISGKGYIKASVALGSVLYCSSRLVPDDRNIVINNLLKRNSTRFGLKKLNFATQYFNEWIPRNCKLLKESRVFVIDEHSIESDEACEIRDYNFIFNNGKLNNIVTLYEHFGLSNNFTQNSCTLIGEFLITHPAIGTGKIKGKLMIAITENYNVVVKGKIKNQWIMAEKV